GPADARRVKAAGHDVRRRRVQFLPDADGRGLGQAGPAPGPVPGAGLRADARDRRAPAQAPETITRPMTISVRLFARARDLADSDTLNLEVPAGATVAEVRRRIAAACPALREFLPRCAIAVGDDFAADEAMVPNDAEVAIIPPVSGG